MTTSGSGATVRSAQVPGIFWNATSCRPRTLSPGARCWTEGPTDKTTPAYSIPPTRGAAGVGVRAWKNQPPPPASWGRRESSPVSIP